MADRVDYNSWIGVKMGMLTVTGISGRIQSDITLIGLCDCGKIHTFLYGNFRRGHILSCGCNRTPKTVTYDYKHPLYKIWIAMRARCYNLTDQYYYNYGGRGVRVCDEWNNSYQPFYDWCISNGWERGLFLDKDIKGSGMLYSPETCSIVTRTENNRTTRTVKLNPQKAAEIKNSTLQTCKIAKIYNISPSHVRAIKRNRVWK